MEDRGLLAEEGDAEDQLWLGKARSLSWSNGAYEKLPGTGLLLAECRICKEEGIVGPKGKWNEVARDEKMLKPCCCGGSMAHVHLKCLRHWVEQRRLDTAEAGLECEVCKRTYRLQIREELDLSWKRLCSYASFSFYAEFFTILVTLVSMVFLFVVFSRGESKEAMGQLGFLAALGMASAVLGLGLFTLLKVVARWKQAISVPSLSPTPSSLPGNDLP